MRLKRMQRLKLQMIWSQLKLRCLLKQSIVEDVQKVVELAGNLQELVVADELLKGAEEVQREDVACSEAGTSEADASEAT